MNDRVLRPTGWGLRALLAIAASIVALGVSTSSRGSELRITPTVKAVQSAMPSVVSIRGEKTVTGTVSAADASRRVNGMGTGVIIDPRGYVITNYHVVQGVRDINVTLSDATTHTASLIARDIQTDLAIIKIDCDQSLSSIRIGRSNDLMVAEPVIAIGNPYGYSDTVTEGIISNLNRALQVNDAQYYDSLIQTNASINPGNSGGPLLNIDGEMIGVTVAVRTGAQGIAFAIPVDRVMQVVSRLMDRVVGERCRHGIRFASTEVDDATAAIAEAMTPSTSTVVPPSQEAVIHTVEPGSPAEAAGLAAGDVIQRIGATAVDRELDFHRAVLGHVPDDSLTVTYLRGGSLMECELQLQSTSDAWSLLGVDLSPIPQDEFQRQFSSTIYRGGLQVSRVRDGGPAAIKGVVEGDVLVGLAMWETISMGNVNFILNRPDFDTLNPLKFTILRDGRALYGFLTVNAPLQSTTITSQDSQPVESQVSSSNTAVQFN